MIMAGASVTNALEKMAKVQESYLYNKLRNPDSKIEAKIQRLRIVYGLNPKQYSVLKRELPYFVCGIFNPANRKKENFAYTESFIIDIDKLSSKNLLVSDVRERIQKDERVYMCFKSPSEDGLKVMFRLKERCYDAGLYSIFYKEFAHRFSVENNLEQVIDTVTSDVSRACFISVDRDVYINENCTLVDVDSFVDTSNPVSVFDMGKEQDAREKEKLTEQNTESMSEHSSDPEKLVLEQIKARLNPGKTHAEKTPVYVPQILEDLMADLRKYIEETGVVVSDIVSIQYGKKIQFKMGLKKAEINLFYGKRGFSIVKSPRVGTDSELNDLMAQLIKSFIDTYQ